MLLGLMKRICPLLSLATIALGCGKKINEKGNTGNNRTIQSLTPSENLTLEINYENSYFKSYVVPHNGWFFLPEKLQVSQGDGLGMKASITYNIDAFEDYEYRCFYESRGNPQEMIFDKCVNQDEQNILTDSTKLSSIQFIQDKEKLIKIKLLTTPTRKIAIQAQYLVDWKITD